MNNALNNITNIIIKKKNDTKSQKFNNEIILIKSGK